MVKHTQTTRRLQATNCLSVFDNFVGLAIKGLNEDTRGSLKDLVRVDTAQKT